MAISPTVNAYQRTITQNRENGTPEQASFNKKFGDKAYQIITSKYPKILSQIITFKIIDSSPDTGFSLGAFIVRAGEDVRYIPVVMSEGEIASAEMVYNKTEDTLMPLSNDIVSDIVNAEMIRPETLVNSPRIENTTELFRDMYRPPSSSNIVMASSMNVSALPNKYKKAISDYLISEPKLLAKIAEFYPLEALASKLAQTKIEPKTAEENPLRNVLKIDDLTSKTAAQLSSDQKQEMLKQGYLICSESNNAIGAIASKGLPGHMESQLKLIEKPSGTNMHGRGFIFRLHGNEIVREKCIVTGNLIFTERGVSNRSSNIVLSDFQDGVSASDLAEFGILPASQLVVNKKEPHGEPETGYAASAYVFYPTKNGTYKIFLDPQGDQVCCGCPPNHKTNDPRAFGLWTGSFEVRNIDGDTYFSRTNDYETSLGFIDAVNVGHVKISDREYVFPKSSYAVHPKEDHTIYISDMGTLTKLFRSTGVLLRMSDNGAGITVSDSTGTKTASFRKLADAVEYLITDCRMTKKAVERLIKDKEVLVLEKKAFVETPPEEYPASGEAMNPSMYGQIDQPDMPAEQEMVEIDEDILADTAGVQDEDLMDTGLLASVAANDDIKSLLVDMLPEFTDTCSMLGKAILMFISNQEEIEDFYGKEDYQGLLGRVRKIFKMLGELVSDLKKYVNM